MLEWINDMALGFIGLSAGGHFRIEEMMGAIAPALAVLAALVTITYSGTLLAIMFLGQLFIPFFSVLSKSQQLAAALLMACLSVARSPSSAIAIISELNAKGPFTTVILAVTVMMDVVVVVLFTITLLIARTLDERALMSNDFSESAAAESAADAAGQNIILIVLADFGSKVLLSAVLGVVLGHLLPLVFAWTPRQHALPSADASIKTLACALLGLVCRTLFVLMQRASFPLSGWLLFFEEQLAEEFHWNAWLNPLISAMVAGFVVVNYTKGGEPFHEATDALAGPIFLLFFCFTGVSMDLGVLRRNVTACVLIFTVRATLIIVSTRIGGACARQPPDHVSNYWMAFLTQAGVTLGLAQSASAHFAWGPDFAASIIAASVLNQVIGPPLLKRAIRSAGEEHHNYVPNKVDAKMAGVGSIGTIGRSQLQMTGRPQPRGALVITESLRALTQKCPGDSSFADDWNEAAVVIRRLEKRGWEVLVADKNFATQSGDESARERLDRNATSMISRLPKQLATQLSAFNDDSLPADLSFKPWEANKASATLAEAFSAPGLVRRHSEPDPLLEERNWLQSSRTPSMPTHLPAAPATAAVRAASFNATLPATVSLSTLASSSSDDIPNQPAPFGLLPEFKAEFRADDVMLASRSFTQSRSQQTPMGALTVTIGGEFEHLSGESKHFHPAPSSGRRPSSEHAAGDADEERIRSPRVRQYSQDDTTVDLGASPRVERTSLASTRERRASRRSVSFNRNHFVRRRRLSRTEIALDMLQAPAVPQMPEQVHNDPVRYAQCMRLLWLAASMKSFDVVVLLLPSDADNVAMCHLVSDMVPMLQYTRKRDPSPPQVVVALEDPDAAVKDLLDVLPVPLVLPRKAAMPSLVCEILHPYAHWSGALDRSGRESELEPMSGEDEHSIREDLDAHKPSFDGTKASLSSCKCETASPSAIAPSASQRWKTAADAFIKFTPSKPKAGHRWIVSNAVVDGSPDAPATDSGFGGVRTML